VNSNINERMSNLLKQATRMSKYDKWLDNLWCIPNSRCSTSLKVFVPALEHHYRTRKSEPDGMRKIWMQDVLDRCGLSHDTGGKALAKLAKVDAINRKDVLEKNKKTRIYIAFNPLFLAEPAQFFTEEGNHGGFREPVKCPHCQEYHPLQKRSTFICGGCGTPIEELTTTRMIPNHPLTEDDINNLPPLPTMEDIDVMYQFTESSDIPDDIFDEQGERVLSMSAPEISKLINTPRYLREGLDDEDWQAVEAELLAIKGMVKHG
jgi:hypothetical protein